METPSSDPVRRALAEGAERSLAAVRPDGTGLLQHAAAAAPAASLAPAPGPPEPLRLVLWRRHKWKIVGLLLLLLTEMVVFLLASTAGTHF